MTCSKSPVRPRLPRPGAPPDRRGPPRRVRPVRGPAGPPRSGRVPSCLAIVFGLFLGLGLGLGLGCHRPPEQGTRGAELVLLHTNDMHAAFLPAPVPWRDDGTEQGGMIWLDARIRQERNRWGEAHTLLLDAGDILTGDPLSQVVVDGAEGGAMVDFLEAMDYDAWTPGNHEFDRGWDNALALFGTSEVPVLCANLLDRRTGTPPPGVQPDRVFRKGELRVGVVGLLTPSLAGYTSPEVAARFEMRDPATAVRERLVALEPSVDLVVVLSHMGVEEDRLLADEVVGIDLVVGGHSHSPLHEPERVGDTWIVQAAPKLRALGRTRIALDGEGAVHVEGELLEVGPRVEGLEPDPEMAARVEHWQNRVEETFGEVLTELDQPLHKGRYGEGPLGHWIADLLRAHTGADVGLYNASGLRATIPAGRVRKLEVYRVFPFGNALATFGLSGHALRRLVLQNARSAARGSGVYYPMAGLSARWRPGDDSPESLEPESFEQELEIRVGPQPLDPDRIYRVASNSFLATNWEGRLPEEPRSLELHEPSIYDLAVARLRVASPGPVPPPAVLAPGATPPSP